MAQSPMKHISFTIYLFASFSALAQNELQFYQQFWQPRYYQNPNEVIESGWEDSGTADAVITINVSDSIAPVLPTQFGTNTPFRNGPEIISDGVRLPMYEKSKFGMYRFPAGSGSNQYFWDGNIPAQFEIPTGDVNPINALQNSAMTPEIFTNFIDTLGAQATVNVNYFYARYGHTAAGTREARVQQAADYAAAFVHRMNVELGANIKFWEIGNEVYGSWEVGFNVNGSNVTGKEYGEDLRVFADAMKVVDPTIKIGAVVRQGASNWNNQLFPEIQDHADFLIVHNYFTNFNNATANNILSSVSKVEKMAGDIRGLVVQLTDKPADHFPIVFTEFNCRDIHSVTMINGLFHTQVLGEIIKNKYGMAANWVSEWRWNITDEYTHGMLAWEDPHQPDYTARQSFIPYHFYAKCFGDKMINSSVTGNNDIKVYASRFSSNEIGLIIINQSGSDQLVDLNITGVGQTTFPKAQWYEFYAQNINEGNKKFFINGETSVTSGGGPNDYELLPPYGATVSGSELFKARKYSVNWVVLSDGLTNSIQNDNNISYLNLFPNPTVGQLFLETELEVQIIKIFDLDGQLILQLKGDLKIIDVSDLALGTYIFEAKTNRGIFRDKFIKQ